MTPQDRVIATAQAQEGYLGKKTNTQLDDPTANPGGLFNKYARDLDALGDFYNGRKNGFDWCDVLVDWVFVTTFGRETAQKLLCQPDRSLGAGTKYSMDYYKAKNQFFQTPQLADQVFFGTATVTSHTGLVVAVKDGYVHTIEGNAGSPSAVRECRYSLQYGKIKGYGRPDWSILPDEKEEEDGDMKYYETLEDVPDWYRPTVEKLVNAGALNGTGDGLNVSEEYCRVMTTLDRLGKLD